MDGAVLREQTPTWRLYERLVASAESNALTDVRLTVIPNATLVGTISGRSRQVDVLIDSRVADGVDRRIVVDAKLRGRRLTITDVEAFLGMMVDCRAQRGVLVCPEGWTAAAQRRAQAAVTVRIVEPDDLEKLDVYGWDACLGRCASESRTPDRAGWVLYDSVFHIGSLLQPMSIVAIAKCDVCHDFHVWCWDCGQHLVLRGDEAEAKCSCDRFWITSIEDDGPDDNPSETQSVCLTCVLHPDGQYMTVDRRPLC